jgi:hypothetical protein
MKAEHGSVTVERGRGEMGEYFNVCFNCEVGGKPHNMQMDMIEKPSRQWRRIMLRQWMQGLEEAANTEGHLPGSPNSRVKSLNVEHGTGEDGEETSAQVFVSGLDMAASERARVMAEVKQAVAFDVSVKPEDVVVDYCYYDTELKHFQTAFHWEVYNAEGVKSGSGAMQVPSELYRLLFEETLIPNERYEQLTMEAFIALAKALAEGLTE